MLKEADYITQHLPQLRCGPAGALRPCAADDAAVVQQSALCSGNARGDRVACNMLLDGDTHELCLRVPLKIW